MAKSTIDVKFKAVRFNEERVKATLAGIKTQFRRIDNKYSVGDILFVQETHAFHEGKVLYKADNPDYSNKWIPSLFLPVKYSRLFLEVIIIRKEKLQEISEQDAIAEGVETCIEDGFIAYENYKDRKQFVCTAKESYRTLWELNNKKKPGVSWGSNPYVYVIEFKVLKGYGNA